MATTSLQRSLEIYPKSPSNGAGDPETFVVPLQQTAILAGNQIQLNIAFAIKAPKAAVKVTIAEELNAKIPYRSPAGDNVILRIGITEFVWNHQSTTTLTPPLWCNH